MPDAQNGFAGMPGFPSNPLTKKTDPAHGDLFYLQLALCKVLNRNTLMMKRTPMPASIAHSISVGVNT